MYTDKTCVVTGASRGIGRGIAEELGRNGANVVVNYRTSERAAHEVVDTIEDAGANAIACRANVGKYDAVASMCDQIHDAFGAVDVLVNNAGITIDRTFENMTPAEWKSVVAVNLTGVFNCTHCLFEDLRRADNGRLINISSVVGQQGNHGQANYATTKSGLFGFTRTLALEMAQSGSTANCVAPGFVKTDMLKTVPDRVKTHLQERIPLDRFAEVEDVTGIVRFLAGPESSYMTGQVIGVNGGMEW
ncbi:beta-ketoacyl-ACP reductase [Halocatena pleomorpha]|uniref:Beta-ketoacyl-ACP reductase n=1 Tax=Halocatena pleomorpha TaxID=1785090 RepID=A0A3P3RCP6_9EURY|nr:beta-ketoacyl-ACP reductase [Halocatena pleomorpha]RRJ31175.1 beta-ketoacyl-ACP reductase [Halocatena pleomorpha]